MNIWIESFGKSIHVIQLYVLFINDGLISCCVDFDKFESMVQYMIEHFETSY
jgi:hypothetical protein